MAYLSASKVASVCKKNVKHLLERKNELTFVVFVLLRTFWSHRAWSLPFPGKAWIMALLTSSSVLDSGKRKWNFLREGALCCIAPTHAFPIATCAQCQESHDISVRIYWSLGSPTRVKGTLLTCCCLLRKHCLYGIGLLLMREYIKHNTGEA